MSNYDNETENLACDLRVTLGLDDLLVMDPVRALDEMKNRGLIANWIVVPDASLPDVDGRYDPVSRIISLPKRTLDGATSHQPRAAFSIAHEIGHVVGRVSEPRNRGVAIRGRRTSRDEAFADRFAAAFLAPFHKSDFGPTTAEIDIQRRFNLSAQASKKRHQELSREFRRRNNIERPLPSVVVSFLEEARARGRDVKSLPVPAKPTANSATAKRAESRREVSTVGEACTGCGWPKVELDGPVRVRCPNCRAVYDRFQDGDSITV